MHMAQSEKLEDRIVAEVMAQLERSEDSAPSPAAPATARILEITDAVITAGLLEERGIKSGPIVVGPKAVLTPSAVDFLANRKINWSRGAACAKSASSAKWLALVTRSTPAVTAALDAVAGESGGEWRRELLGCHREACERAMGALCRGEADGALVVTDKPEAVACRVNRNPVVRAVAITTVARIKTLKREMSPNLFAIDPTGRTEFELRSCLREIASDPKPAATSEWKE
jgi:hypothetical protein